jgi:hypothetical protein
MFESVAFGTHAKNAAFDKDKLPEGKDGEGDVNEYVGSVRTALWRAPIVRWAVDGWVRAWRGSVWRAVTGEGDSSEHPSYHRPNE